MIESMAPELVDPIGAQIAEIHGQPIAQEPALRCAM